MTEIISVKTLEKSYKGKKVIQGISFGVNTGEILCFLGPNGAGKSYKPPFTVKKRWLVEIPGS